MFGCVHGLDGGDGSWGISCAITWQLIVSYLTEQLPYIDQLGSLLWDKICWILSLPGPGAFADSGSTPMFYHLRPPQRQSQISLYFTYYIVDGRGANLTHGLSISVKSQWELRESRDPPSRSILLGRIPYWICFHGRRWWYWRCRNPFCQNLDLTGSVSTSC